MHFERVATVGSPEVAPGAGQAQSQADDGQPVVYGLR